MALTLPNLTVPQDAIRFALSPLEALFDIEPLVGLRARLDKRMDGQTGGGALTRHRLEELRQRLRTMPFEEATAVKGRERLLLSLYLLDTNKPDACDYLPEFDEAICEEILGAPAALAAEWRLRQAAQLFFVHFDRLPGRILLGRLIQRALVASGDSFNQANMDAWRKSLAWLFGGNGPERIVDHRRPAEKLMATAERYNVPPSSRFLELAHQCYFQSLRTMPLGEDGPIFDELIEQRNAILPGGRLLGVAAVETLISRSLSENNGRLPDAWGARMGALSCEPRLPRQSSEFNRWWSWADDRALAVPLSWYTGRDVEAFLLLLTQSLEGESASSIARRAAFLRTIHRSHKIIRARLGLVERAYLELPRLFPEPGEGAAVARMRSRDGISVLCVQCEGFCFVEGTGNFAIQLHKEFPIEGFWEGADLPVDGQRPATRFDVADFRKNRIASIPHMDSAMMKWEHKFLNALQAAPLYLRWPDVRF